MKDNKQFLTGSQVCLQACKDAGADVMFGYPITPTSEVFAGWIQAGWPHLQTEDEVAAGFAVCGAVLTGKKAFTATAGPGHTLMQDGLSMAEGMRLPFVTIVGMRGGPSSGTVIYSQQEVTLACYGGNGEGMRIVYSPSNLEEMYELTIKTFNDAWQYRFPATLLTDGYLLKMKGIFTPPANKPELIEAKAIVADGDNVHLPSIYTLEEELYEKLQQDKKDFDTARNELEMSEEYMVEDAEVLLIAYGIVGASAKQAVNDLRDQGKKVGLFRPISLRPFPKQKLDQVLKKVNQVCVVESAFGQLERLVRDEMDSKLSIDIKSLHYPGLGIEPEEIISKL